MIVENDLSTQLYALLRNHFECRFTYNLNPQTVSFSYLSLINLFRPTGSSTYCRGIHVFQFLYTKDLV